MAKNEDPDQALGSAILGILLIAVSILLGIGLVILGLGLWILNADGISLLILAVGAVLTFLGILAGAYTLASYLGRLRV